MDGTEDHVEWDKPRSKVKYHACIHLWNLDIKWWWCRGDINVKVGQSQGAWKEGWEGEEDQSVLTVHIWRQQNETHQNPFEKAERGGRNGNITKGWACSKPIVWMDGWNYHNEPLISLIYSNTNM
jgi:hypothetical protein